MSKTLQKWLMGALTVLLLVGSIPVTFAYSSVVFEVGANDFTEHYDYNNINIVPNAYVNVYEISDNANLGYYKGTLIDTLYTGSDGMAEVTVEYGEMVDFLTFKTQAAATEAQYDEWKFYTPPYKNFGNNVDELCQTNFYDFDEYLQYSEDYACATSLTSPYEDTGYVDNTLYAPAITSPYMDQVLTNYPRKAYISWTEVNNATGYEIEVACDVCTSTETYWLNPSTYYSYYNYITTSALAGDNGFRVRVRAYNSEENGPWSSYVYFSYDTSADVATLGTPSITSPYMDQVLTNYPRKASIAWTDVDNATGYEIEVACDVCSSTSTYWLNPSTYYSYYNYLTTPALAGDNEFRVRVRAYNNVTEGPWSSYVYFSYDTSSASSTLTAPTITYPYMDQVLTNYPREAYMSWTSVSSATEYEIEVACDVCTSTTTKWLNPSTYFSDYNYLTTPALAGDNEFRFRVRALNSSQTGPWSSYVYFSYDTSGYVETLGTPSIISPYMDQVLTNYPREAYLSWTSVYGATGYDVEVACDVCTSTTTKWLNPTMYQPVYNYLVTDPLAGDNGFRVRVRAVNNVTQGPWSSYIYFSYDTSAYVADDDYGWDDYYDWQYLPPAGYEDEVITTFDEYNNPFPDTSLSTLEGKAAAELYRRGVIGGFPDGEFKGYRDVNRAELAKFLLLARYGYVDDISNNGQFYDVLEGEWYVKFVVTAANKGIISGYSDGSFKPANTVNRAEFLKMLALTFDLEMNLSYSYNDVFGGEWYAQYVGVAQEYDLFPTEGSYLYPSQLMTRSEVAIAIYQFLLNR